MKATAGRPFLRLRPVEGCGHASVGVVVVRGHGILSLIVGVVGGGGTTSIMV